MKYYRHPGGATASFLYILVMSVICCASANPVVRNGQGTLSVETENTILSREALQHDTALNRVVAFRFDEARLDETFKALTDQRNLKLTVISDLAPRRITARCKHTTIASFMIALSRVLGVSWRKSGDSYILFQTGEQIRAEDRKKRDSEANEQRFVDAQGNNLRTQLEHALSQTGANREIFSDFLAGCKPDTINRGIASALEDEPFLSAVDQSHFHNHFLPAGPLSALPSGQQAAVRQIASDGGYSHIDAGSSIGLIAAAGGFRLGIVEPNGRDVWVAPQHAIGQVSTVTQSARENDFDPAVVELLRSDRLVGFGSLTNSFRHKKFKVESGTDRSRLAIVLQNISTQTDVDFLCDCYLNSAQTLYSYNPDTEWTVEQALTAVARTFGHKMLYHGGLLEITAVTPGLDLRLESPIAVINSLDAQALTGHLPNKEDLIVLSACNQEQLQILAQWHPVNNKTHTGHILQALRVYPFLHFYGSLSRSQQQDAFSERGVNVRDLSVAKHRLFDALFTIGLAKMTPTRYKLERNRFYLKSNGIKLPDGGRRDSITFIATAPDNLRYCRMAGL